MLLTLDSSVFVAALRTQEPHHLECRRILERLRDGEHIAVEPFTVLVEVVAAVRRRTGSPDLAMRVHRDLRSLQALRFAELDSARADAAADLGRELGLRGMDAIVVQIAREFDAALVSLDEEMIARVQPVARVASLADVV